MKVIGNYLNDEEINTLISGFNEKEKFNSLVEKIKQYTKFSFNKNELKVIQGIKFAVQYDKGEVISVKSLRLQINEKVELMYLERFKNNDKTTKNELLRGTFSF